MNEKKEKGSGGVRKRRKLRQYDKKKIKAEIGEKLGWDGGSEKEEEWMGIKECNASYVS